MLIKLKKKLVHDQLMMFMDKIMKLNHNKKFNKKKRQINSLKALPQTLKNTKKKNNKKKRQINSLKALLQTLKNNNKKNNKKKR